MTKVILAITLVILIAYDVFVYLYFGVNKTISRVTLAISQTHPIIPFALGIVCGHLFWTQG